MGRYTSSGSKFEREQPELAKRFARAVDQSIGVDGRDGVYVSLDNLVEAMKREGVQLTLVTPT